MTVDFVLNGPLSAAAERPLRHFIMDKEWLAANDALKPGNTSTASPPIASTHANGTGPFMLESYQPDSKTVLVVNEKWWDKPEHNLKRIEFRPIKSDATRVAALLSGELDMVAPAPLQDLARISATPGYKVIEEPSLRLIFLGLNWRPELLAAPGQKNPLLDVKVRQALGTRSTSTPSRSASCAASRVQSACSSHRPCRATPPSSTPRSASISTRRRSCSPKQAIPTASRRASPARTTVTSRDEQTCVAIAAMWTRAGVQVDLKTESRTTYFPKVDRGETDIYMLGWATLPPMDGYSVLSAILASRKGGFGGNNPNGMVNAKLDELNKKAGVELDEPKRRAMLTEALKIAHDEALFIPIHQQPVAWAMTDECRTSAVRRQYVRLWYATITK